MSDPQSEEEKKTDEESPIDDSESECSIVDSEDQISDDSLFENQKHEICQIKFETKINFSDDNDEPLLRISDPGCNVFKKNSFYFEDFKDLKLVKCSKSNT